MRLDFVFKNFKKSLFSNLETLLNFISIKKSKQFKNISSLDFL